MMAPPEAQRPHPQSQDHLSGDSGEPHQLERIRYRIRFAKRGTLRFTSHLDLARVWERTLRRAGAPLVYSQGFNPRPQIQIAAALPLGFESTCELLDIWLEGSNIPPPGDLAAALRRAAPEGLEVESIWPVDLRGPALQNLTRSATYEVRLSQDVSAGELEARLADLLSREAIWRERRGKRYDLRPLILAATVRPGDSAVLQLEMALSQEAGTGRPDEVLDALGLDPLSARVVRTALNFERSPL